MKNKGCAFEIKGDGKSRYYSAPAVSGLADFARFLYENRASATGTPLPIRERIPQAEEISETAWQKIADHKAAGCACYFMLDIRENQVWVNEDTLLDHLPAPFVPLPLQRTAQHFHVAVQVKLLGEHVDLEVGWGDFQIVGQVGNGRALFQL